MSRVFRGIGWPSRSVPSRLRNPDRSTRLEIRCVINLEGCRSGRSVVSAFSDPTELACRVKSWRRGPAITIQICGRLFWCCKIATAKVRDGRVGGP